jgi:hypothetical protein
MTRRPARHGRARRARPGAPLVSSARPRRHRSRRSGRRPVRRRLRARRSRLQCLRPRRELSGRVVVRPRARRRQRCAQAVRAAGADRVGADGRGATAGRPVGAVRTDPAQHGVRRSALPRCRGRARAGTRGPRRRAARGPRRRSARGPRRRRPHDGHVAAAGAPLPARPPAGSGVGRQGAREPAPNRSTAQGVDAPRRGGPPRSRLARAQGVELFRRWPDTRGVGRRWTGAARAASRWSQRQQARIDLSGYSGARARRGGSGVRRPARGRRGPADREEHQRGLGGIDVGWEYA